MSDPNYIKSVLDIATGLKPGRAYVLMVMHDDWCDQLNRRGVCNCDPETQLRDVTESKP